MQDRSADRTRKKHAFQQLHRLERLADVVYALIIWRCFMLLPRPTAEQWSGENIGVFLSDNIGAFTSVFIGIIFTIIYWLQNNVLLGNLRGTDSRHTILSILQYFFLLIFLLSLRLYIDSGASTGSLVLRSIAAALVGMAGGWGWSYAIKNHRLLLPEVTEQFAYQLRDRILAEPITAIITLPVAFVGPILWQISWLCYPLVVMFVRYGRRSKNSPEPGAI